MLSRVLPASRQTCHIRHIVHELEFCTRQLLSSSRLTCPEHISRHARYLSKRRYATITSIPSHASSSHIHAARSSPAASSSQGHQVTTTSSKLTFDEYSSTVRARQSPDISEPPCMGTALALDPNTTVGGFPQMMLLNTEMLYRPLYNCSIVCHALDSARVPVIVLD